MLITRKSINLYIYRCSGSSRKCFSTQCSFEHADRSQFSCYSHAPVTQALPTVALKEGWISRSRIM